MRHRKSGRRLGRNSSHRKAMFRNMAASLVEHETIKTTLPKAKELRRVVEPLITLAKEDGVANRRLAFDRLRDKAAVGKLFADLGPRFKDRPGGYLRILKTGPRPGDAAPMAIVATGGGAAGIQRNRRLGVAEDFFRKSGASVSAFFYCAPAFHFLHNFSRANFLVMSAHMSHAFFAVTGQNYPGYGDVSYGN